MTDTEREVGLPSSALTEDPSTEARPSDFDGPGEHPSSQPPPGRHRRIRDSQLSGWAREELGYRPFLVLLALGVFVRVAVIVMYWPAWLQTVDSPRFARISPQPLFSDYWMPAGYAVFAKYLRELIHPLGTTIILQHLIGLSVGVALYLTMRRLGAVRWLACIPAGVAFLSGDQVFLEHTILADWFMTVLVVAGLACAVRGLVPEIRARWLAAGSGLLMCAALTRSVALPLVPLLAVIAAAWAPGSLRGRIRALLLAVLPAVAVFGVYFGAFELKQGQYLGLGDMGGWNLYSRVAPFADCSKFTPPKGTRVLCQPTPPSRREGSLGYEWDPTSWGQRYFQLGPRTSGTMERFAIQVILHQPGDYAATVLTELSRYLDPTIGPARPYGGEPPQTLSFGLQDPATRQIVEKALSKGYTGTTVHVIGRQVLSTYQDLFRVSGLGLAALVVLTLVGAFLASGAVRLGISLFGLSALVLYLVPVMTLSWDYRYGIPPGILVVVSGVLGAATLLARKTGIRMFEPR